MNPRSRALRRTKSNLCSGGLCDDPAILRRQITNDKARAMIQPPETVRVTRSRVACDGASDIPGGAAPGHPRIYLEIAEKGYVECGYCDPRLVQHGRATCRESVCTAEWTPGGAGSVTKKKTTKIE